MKTTYKNIWRTTEMYKLGRKEREAEIIEVIDKCYELNILTPNQITEIIKQIKEQKL